MILISMLWALALYISQFYILPSGVPQPGHVLAAMLFIVVFFSQGLKIKIDGHAKEVLTIFYLLLFYVVLINFSWALIEQDTDFISSSLFWFYSFLLFYFLTSSLSQHEGIRSWLLVACVIGVSSLLGFWLLGLGRYDSYPRYNGFFNDPNQMAYWVICIFGVFFYSSKNINRYLVLAFSLLCIVVVFSTQSRSALLGVFFCFAAAVLRVMAIGGENSAGFKKSLTFIVGVMVVSAAIYFILSADIFQTTIMRLASTDFKAQAEVRGYGRFIKYPEYLIFGSGQGLDWRFGSGYEIHSTWAGIFFYYGIIGLSIFLCFLYKIFSRLDVAEKVAFLGPVVYGFFTYGARTPVFWFFLAAAAYAASRNLPMRGKGTWISGGV